MRSQRNFVVEIKSSRCRPKANVSSIWGDTDFKAIQREMAVEAPHVFEDAHELATPHVLLPAKADVADRTPPVAEPQEQVAETTTIDAVQFAPDPQKRPSARRQTVATRQPAPERDGVAKIASGNSLPSALSFDSLIALENENQKLRQQLRDRLEAESAQLVQLLKRVENRNRISASPLAR